MGSIGKNDFRGRSHVYGHHVLLETREIQKAENRKSGKQKRCVSEGSVKRNFHIGLFLQFCVSRDEVSGIGFRGSGAVTLKWGSCSSQYDIMPGARILLAKGNQRKVIPEATRQQGNEAARPCNPPTPLKRGNVGEATRQRNRNVDTQKTRKAKLNGVSGRITD